MVESKCEGAPVTPNPLILPIANAAAQVTIQNNPHTGIRAADFVGRTQGKLRDFYRIGKVLGTGK